MAVAALNLPRAPAVAKPRLPANLPALRPLGARPAFRFASSLERVQAAPRAVQFVRPDVPASEEAPRSARKEPAGTFRPTAAGRSALEQAALLTNNLLHDRDDKSREAKRRFPKLGVFGL